MYYYNEGETLALNFTFREGTVVEFDLIPDSDVPYKDFVLRMAVRYSDKDYNSDDYDHDLFPTRIGYAFYQECKNFLGVQYLTASDMRSIKFIECFINGYGLAGMFPIKPYEKITNYISWFLDKIKKHGLIDLSAWNVLLYPEDHMN